MYPILLEKLQYTITSYNKLRNRHELTPEAPQRFRNLSMSVIAARMEALSAQNMEDDTEFKVCRFLIKALNNGWLASDIKFLINLFDAIYLNPGEIVRSKGMDILDQIALKKIDTIEKRFTMMDIIADYFTINDHLHLKPADVSRFYVNKTKDVPLYKEEYPDDPHFDDFSIDVKGIRTAKGKYVSDKNEYIKNLEKKKTADAKEKTTYVKREITRQERINNELEPFIRNVGQIHNRIIKAHKQVISEVFGEEVYDEIDEMSIGFLEERTVPIFHSQGTKWAREGHEVLEMHFAGSGATDVPNLHKGRNGDLDLITVLKAAGKMHSTLPRNFWSLISETG